MLSEPIEQFGAVVTEHAARFSVRSQMVLAVILVQSDLIDEQTISNRAKLSQLRSNLLDS